jgi:hypothetical protein
MFGTTWAQIGFIRPIWLQMVSGTKNGHVMWCRHHLLSTNWSHQATLVQFHVGSGLTTTTHTWFRGPSWLWGEDVGTIWASICLISSLCYNFMLIQAPTSTHRWFRARPSHQLPWFRLLQAIKWIRKWPKMKMTSTETRFFSFYIHMCFYTNPDQICPHMPHVLVR